MRLHATELICSTGVSCFQILNSCFAYIINCFYTLKFWAIEWMTSLFPRSNPLRSSRSVVNVSNGGPWNPKLTLKIKINAQNFARQVLSKHTFKIWRKKKKSFFDHRTTLTFNGRRINDLRRPLFLLTFSSALMFLLLSLTIVPRVYYLHASPCRAYIFHGSPSCFTKGNLCTISSTPFRRWTNNVTLNRFKTRYNQFEF